ncbi:hypothetical protein AncyloWKF20_09505 [Ancylobacter sp. WKF20]|uniref:hypothetical protein n=1 Tax=Ancylobacter sp. WKF20 TaxID=3039801 RepID=UPI00243428BF|nr:hypothetical protein [Ancylobacter sp. WKF20]WGD32028.1 hypothetical protein AncyloWKF20_09505 [Ancylobacter sp. WKF20]
MHMHSGERPSLARTFEMIETTALRRRMERAVEALLAALDELGGDPDLEPTGDELDTSAPEGWRRFDMLAANDDAEDDDPAELDDFAEEDDPPEDGHDAEDNRDDLEPDADGEPSVGWITNEQGSFYRGERI